MIGDSEEVERPSSLIKTHFDGYRVWFRSTAEMKGKKWDFFILVKNDWMSTSASCKTWLTPHFVH